MDINRSWHQANPMPKSPTLAQRIDWHTRHAAVCGCRPIPQSIRQTMAALNSSNIRTAPSPLDETRYMVAIPMPEPLATKLADLQQTYRNKRWHITIEPHITIISPGPAVVGHDRAVELFQSLELPQAPAAIQLSGVSRFHARKQNVLYLEPSQTDWLAEVHQLLRVEAESWQDTFTGLNRQFMPHLTVSNHLTDAEATQFERRLIDEALSFDFRPTELSLFAKTPQELRWQRLTALKFANGLR